MSNSRLEVRCTVQNPCQVCGRTRSCSHGPADSGNGRKYMCYGTPGSAEWVLVKPCANGFNLYRHQEDLDRDRQSYYDRKLFSPSVSLPKKEEPPKPVTDWSAVARRHVAEISDDLRYELAERLGVPRSVFDTAPLLGYSRQETFENGELIEHGFWTTPEVNAAGQLVGLERRWRKEQKPAGEDKMAYRGSNRGLVLPTGWRDRSGPGIGVEGFSGAMAATAAGWAAIGRPGKDGGVPYLIELFRDWPTDRGILIVADNDPDGDGERGAVTTAEKMSAALGRPIMWSLCPPGFKDVREFLKDTGDGVHTHSRWQGVSWAERGAQLLAHLVEHAVTIGGRPEPVVAVASVTAAAAAAEPVSASTAVQPAAQPVALTLTFDADAATASESLKDLLTPVCRCDNPRILIGKRPSTGKRGAVPFGCHKTACHVCGLFKKGNLFQASEGYIERLTNPATNDGEAYTVYMAVTPVAQFVAVKRSVERKGGKYLAIDTTDPVGCSEAIAAVSTPEVSHLGHVNQDCSSCPKCDTSASDEPHILWTVLLPAGKAPPRSAEFVQATHAAPVLRAWGNALTTTPTPPEEGVTRFRFYRASRAWGEKIEKPIGDFKPEGVAIYAQDEIRKLVQSLRVATNFWFADPKVQGRPVGWNAGPAASLCVSLLLRGADAPHRYGINRVEQLAREWIEYLPPDLRDGWRVEKLLREHLWTGTPLVCIHDELRAADEEDRAEEAARAEASELYAALRDSYRGREHEATGLLAELLA